MHAEASWHSAKPTGSVDAIAQQVVVIGEAFRDPERVLNGFQFLRIALANRDEIGVGMRLIDGNEFGAESEADDRDIYFFRHG